MVTVVSRTTTKTAPTITTTTTKTTINMFELNSLP